MVDVREALVVEKVLQGVVAVDGPSGTGKSTTARGLAMRLGARYLDTGAMYRAATLAVMRSGVAPDATTTDADGHDEAVAVALAADLVMSTDPAEPRVRLGGEDVAAEIRGVEVTRNVSAISALTEVRRHLVDEQRRIIAEAHDDGSGIVVEGRDIGTVVAPDADLKIYLVASDTVRAGRRSAEDTSAGRATDATTTGADLARRDRLDSSRAASPLRAAEDAVEVDTSALDVEGVLDRLEELAAERGMLVSALVHTSADGR
ncbi:(d)CMP kinase [Actinomycetospora chiangmaiensis]|uniref:(d)CMP kinase n=1 Tax=Actinomycetospora chiangmaiensis TaxID=402650 RepID=UPI00036FF837|nr:(d)CMP kinase [Actinomycetospora chiangmaiensis]